MIYSKKDPVADPVRIEEVIQNWLKSGLLVNSSVFEESAHVSHMMAYYDAYWKDLDAFIKPLLSSYISEER